MPSCFQKQSNLLVQSSLCLQNIIVKFIGVDKNMGNLVYITSITYVDFDI
jgi:hypothetical protein